VNWKNRAQFVGIAAVMMRRILVNHARDRAADKRGGDMQKVPLSDADQPGALQDVDVIVLHEALDQLGAIVGGLTTHEIAEALQLSPATIERDWSARAWLYDATGGE
jgi:RNA polymerase sigma-70 factor, ECF subfamily